MREREGRGEGDGELKGGEQGIRLGSTNRGRGEGREGQESQGRAFSSAMIKPSRLPHSSERSGPPKHNESITDRPSDVHDAVTVARSRTFRSRNAHGGSEAKHKGLRERISPTCTLSQNGYGARLRTCLSSLPSSGPRRWIPLIAVRGGRSAYIAVDVPRRICHSTYPRIEERIHTRTRPTKQIIWAGLVKTLQVRSVGLRKKLMVIIMLSLRKGQ